MCGIAGVIGKAARDPALLRQMAGAIAHRGPDDEGIWSDDEAGVGLAFRRLAILDLSPEGRQPMHSADDRLVIVFNGEIYNHRELRAEIDAAGGTPAGGWRGHSDTEILLQAITIWGLDAAIGKSVGMFAFALWDGKERSLSLGRDRFGEKPLYYGWAGRDLLFGSELKALRAHPAFDAAIDRRALRQYASLAYVPAPRTIYQRIFKLPPASILTVQVDNLPSPGAEPLGSYVRRYWSYVDAVAAGLRDPLVDEGEALDALEAAIGQAVRGQSVADVPVGAFLSGGVDSSTVCALYQRHSPNPIRTYSIGFEEAAYNEADDARRVAARLGTLHREHFVTVDEARQVIPLLPAMYDEPFADSSQIPTFLVSRFARSEVTVALTGDGGDELFGGYNRHVILPRLWKALRRVPQPLRALASRIPLPVLAAATSGRGPQAAQKLHKALAIAGSARDCDELYAALLDEWALAPSPVRGGGDPTADEGLLLPDAPDAVRMMTRDALTYLPDDILCKVDRASMAVSLETRAPFLDHRLAELAARIPVGMKIRGGRGKHILRQLLHRHAPAALFDRPKAGFAVPVGEWIRGPLKSWAEDLLDPTAMRHDGFFDPAIVLCRWHEHRSGQRDSTQALWAILMFQAWRRAQA